MSFIALDIGASSTRFVSENGKIGILPNNMVVVPLDQRIDLIPYSNGEDMAEDLKNALDVTITKISGEKSDFFPVRVLVGQMAERYSSVNIRPSVMSNKHIQQVNHISGILATAFNRLLYNLTDDTYMYIALPPLEVKTAKDYVSSQFKGTFEVTFNKFNNTKVVINTLDVICNEESFMALLAYYFEMNGSLREEALKYSTGYLLSLDIGASTTDLAVVKDRKYLEKSGQTYKTGGNVARDMVANDIRAKYGYDPTDEETEAVMSEGRLQMGNSYVDMSESVNNAKRAFASQIVNSIQSYFRLVNIPIQNIRAIVVSGGGSMHSEYTDDAGQVHITSEPISTFILEELHKVCDTVDVVAFSSNPRQANVIGLYIKASFDELKRKMEKQNSGHQVATPVAPQVANNAVNNGGMPVMNQGVVNQGITPVANQGVNPAVNTGVEAMNPVIPPAMTNVIASAINQGVQAPGGLNNGTIPTLDI